MSETDYPTMALVGLGIAYLASEVYFHRRYIRRIRNLKEIGSSLGLISERIERAVNSLENKLKNHKNG